MGDLVDYNSSPPSSAAVIPPASNNWNLSVCEDCWSEEATAMLVEAWSRRYVELNRGHLRQDWQEVADTVNSLHRHSKKTYRTDVQCKNRIYTVKKKYKVEKARVVMSNRLYVSSWNFYNRLDVLIGPTTPACSGAGGLSHGGPSSSSGKKAGQQHQGSAVPLARSPPVGVPLFPHLKAVQVARVGVGPGPVVAMAAPKAATAAVAVSLSHKRERDIRRNYSEVAAAAAAAENMEDDDDELHRGSKNAEELEKESDEEGDERGMRRLAKAIEKLGEVYRQMEGEKLTQKVELEKQRMQFAKDLEVQRLKMFMDTQVQMERLKHAKRTESDGRRDFTSASSWPSLASVRH